MNDENKEVVHSLVLNNKNELIIKGVKTIQSFDSYEFLIETIMGFMLIKGKGLGLGRMDNDKEELYIKGDINSLEYVSNKKEKNESLFKKIFK